MTILRTVLLTPHSYGNQKLKKWHFDVHSGGGFDDVYSDNDVTDNGAHYNLGDKITTLSVTSTKQQFCANLRKILIIY